MSPTLEEGTVFAGYRIVSVLGRGGMGVVYRAEDLRLGREVALKVLAPERAADQGFQERFIRESRHLASIDHPNIVDVYRADESEGLLFLAMRFVEGQDLGTLVSREAPLDAARVVHIATQVASALDEAHARGIVHRDVKPGNVLVAPGRKANAPERVYLTDFGLTKLISSQSGLTTVGQFLGTPAYVAPEQIQGLAVDGRADLYALGCVVYECLTGAAPYAEAGDAAVLMAHLMSPPPSVLARRPELPPAVDDVVGRAMAKVRDQRYATCTDFATGLAAALEPEIQRTRETAPPAGEEAPPAESTPTTLVAPPPTVAADAAPPTVVADTTPPTVIAEAAPATVVSPRQHGEPGVQPPAVVAPAGGAVTPTPDATTAVPVLPAPPLPADAPAVIPPQVRPGRRRVAGVPLPVALIAMIASIAVAGAVVFLGLGAGGSPGPGGSPSPSLIAGGSAGTSAGSSGPGGSFGSNAPVTFPPPSGGGTTRTATEADNNLLTRIPDTLRARCSLSDASAEDRKQALSVIDCTPGSGPNPSFVRYLMYNDLRPFAQAYDALLAEAQAQSEDLIADRPTLCENPPFTGGHGPYGGTVNPGRLICYLDAQGQSTYVWTVDALRIIAIARRDDADHRVLFEWWRDPQRSGPEG